MTRRLWGRGAAASRRNATKTLALFLGLGNFPPASRESVSTFMEIKIECACGQPFEFAVEPVNGRMPCEVKCPACGADATVRANVLISEQLPQKPAVTPQPAPSLAMRINRTFTPPAPAPVAAVAPARAAPLPARTASKPSAPRDNSFLKGVIGALIASLVGMIGWFLLIKATGVEIGYAAWGVGAIIGLGARLVGGEGGFKLGATAGLFALLAILGGQFLAVRSIALSEIDKMATVKYQEIVDTLNQLVAAKSEADMKAVYAQQHQIQVSDISEARWENFKQAELPNIQKLVAGKLTKGDFLKETHQQVFNLNSQFGFFMDSFGLFTLLWIFLGVSSAYKIGSGSNQ
jgi:hypothetical protein